jgi:hypothetical protein
MRQRYAARADTATQAIVDELRALGYSVTFLGLPVDLAVHHPKWGANEFKLLEVKSTRLKKSGDIKHDKRRVAQAAFCETHGVPYVTNTIEALQALGEIA